MYYVFFDIFHFLLLALIVWQYASTLFRSHLSKEKTLLLSVVIYTLPFIAHVTNQSSMMLSVFLVCNFIFFKVIIRCRYMQSILHVIIILSSLYLSHVLSTPLLSILIGSWTDIGPTILTPAYQVGLYFFILQAILFLYSLFNKLKNVNYFKSVILFLFPVLTLSGIVFHAKFYKKIASSFEKLIYIDTFILMSGYMLTMLNIALIAFYQHLHQNNLELLEQQKEQDTLEYHNMLLEQHEAQRILLHDMKNHLTSIALLNEKGNNEEVSTYINNLVNSTEFKGTSRVSDNEFLNSLLSRYICLCRDKNIDLRLDIRKGSLTAMPNEHLTALVCNLLDNAVEATESQEEAFIEFCIYPKENTPFTVLTLTNSCLTNPFSKETGALITHKEDKHMHGFGMKSVQKIVGKYNGDMQSYYSEEDCTFHTILTIKSNS